MQIVLRKTLGPSRLFGAADNFGSLSWERLDASGLTAAQLDEKDLAWAASPAS